MPKIVPNKIIKTIKQSKTYKTFRPDKIPNKMLKLIAGEIVGYFKLIFNNFLDLGYYFLHFKKLVIGILCKYRGNKK